MSLCVICMTKKATVPDKNRPGKPVNRFCLACHEQKLIDDLQMALVSQAEYHAAAQDAAIYGQGFALVSAENVEHISAAEVLAQQPEEQHPDDAAVDLFASAMKAKLNKKRQEGRGGWQSMTAEQLSALLHEHVRKGDPVDVANLAMMLHQNGQRIEQQPAPINVVYTDGCGAGRRSPADCRYGVSYVTVADTVYWPLSADDAQRLRAAECGRGDFTGPTNECSDVAGLVEALELMVTTHDEGGWPTATIAIARAALAAYRKQGDEQ